MRCLVIPALAASLVLTSCTSDKQSPDPAADELADALATGDLSVLEDESAQPAYDAIVEGLGDVSPTVETTEVTEGEGAAEATMTWSWELDGQTWSYDTTATLEETETGWQATWSPRLVEPTLEDGETLATSTIEPSRGDILGARGEALVTERPVVRYGIDKTKVKPRRAVPAARQVARLLDLDAASYAKAVRAAGDKAFVEALVLRADDAREVDPAYADIPGAVALQDSMPLAPTREFAAPILGRVGAATAELIEESEGRLEIGDVTGLSGLQARYDEQLTGAPGLRVDAVNEDGADRPLFTAKPVDGKPLRTTLDRRLQFRAERVLGDDPESPVSALVAVRPSTGEVLAAANGPGNDGLNAATFGQYPPGSTFKIVSALALLRSGLAPESPIDCPPSVVVDGKRFENYDDYPPSMLGRITLREAVAHSCNTAFIGARDRIDEGTLQSAAEALGLGVDFDLGFPAYFGQVPPPESETEAAADLIGQGTILASPLAMASAAASVRAGRTVVPHLLGEYAPAADPSQPLTRKEGAALRTLMRAVVTEGSGGSLADNPGEVGAKTGTAEYGEPGPDGSLPTHAWMVATTDDLAVAVFVETAAGGSRTAGPLLDAFLPTP
jgi:cell division protein FtsI/penicillin-binding protein 2